MRRINFTLKFLLSITLPLTCTLLNAAQQPPQTSPQMQAAIQLVRAQKLTEAVTALDEVSKNEPKNARAWFLLGQLNHQLGNYEKAVQAYEKNIPLSNNPSSMYNLACSHSRLKQNDKAFEWLEKAITVGNGGGLAPETDEDLANLRSDPRFPKTLEMFNRKAKPCLYQTESRQFDFWVGEWDVFPSQAPAGQAPKVGENKVERISEGCGLLESWKSPSDNGKSINYYDRITGKWHQYWIGSRGETLRYEGIFKENSMNFTGESVGKDGKKTLNRLTFFKVNENTVRQFAEISDDDGKTWQVSYDFRYARKSEKASIIPAKVESASSTTGGIPSNTIEIPKGATITVDGKMNEDEWKDALTQDLKGGGQLKLKHDGEFLLIGLQGGKPGLSHVYLTDGKDIYVLHASAALGQAIYKKEGEAWQPAQKFNWELRDQTANVEGSSNYLKTNKWLASIPTPPTTAREYKVAMKFRDGEVFRMAATFTNNPTSPQFFPQTLADHTLKLELLFGSEPPNLNFNKEQWATLKLKEK